MVLSPRQVADLLGHSTSQITEMYYVKKDTTRLQGITDGFNFSRSKLAQGRAPRIFDDLLMMCQTERLETDTTRYEKSAKYTP